MEPNFADHSGTGVFPWVRLYTRQSRSFLVCCFFCLSRLDSINFAQGEIKKDSHCNTGNSMIPHPLRNVNKSYWTATYRLSSFSFKAWKSNHLQEKCDNVFLFVHIIFQRMNSNPKEATKLLMTVRLPPRVSHLEKQNRLKSSHWWVPDPWRNTETTERILSIAFPMAW